MSKKRLTFFAEPNEQLRWLRDRLSNPEIWCVGESGLPAVTVHGSRVTDDCTEQSIAKRPCSAQPAMPSWCTDSTCLHRRGFEASQLDSVNCENHRVFRPSQGMNGYLPASGYITVDLHTVESLQFTGVHGNELMLFFGHRALQASVVWRVTAGQTLAIDFIRSQAIQYIPSLVVDGSILTEGQLAIMDSLYYEEAGIDPKPLQNWFRDIVKSLRGLGAAGSVLGKVGQTSTKRWPSVVVSPGAVKWRRSGHKLKQFPKGVVEFDVV